MERNEYDVIVVGTGAGGGAALWRLCERWEHCGKRIGVVEAGDLLLQTHAVNIATMNHERVRAFFLNPKVSEPVAPALPGARQLFALGGRTLFWSAVTPRMPLSETETWPISPKELNGYYSIAERVMNVTNHYDIGSSLTNVLLERLQENGFSESKSAPRAVNLESSRLGLIQSNVYFSSIEFLAAALNKLPYDLAVKARAVQVITEQGKVSGVKVVSPERKSYFLRSKKVILSANAYQTPRILLNSGIQGEAIGHYLTCHSKLIALAAANRSDFPEPLGILNIITPQTAEKPYQYQWVGPDPGRAHQPYQEIPFHKQVMIEANIFGKVEARYENKVYVIPQLTDEYGMPKLQVSFSFSQKDVEIIRRMTEEAKKMALAMKVDLISICQRPAGDDFHDSSTCRMGNDPATSATNRYGQIHGVSGLYVADNSVLPSNGATNPTLTTVALAIRTADYIVEMNK
nr:GMC oxidoreductase [Paenibacillus montanisoli]